MRTPAARRRHGRESLRYETDLTDQEWNLIAPMMPAAAKTGQARRWPLREIVNVIFYVMRGGIGWRLLPLDFPPGSTAFRWFCRFRDECLFEKINHRLLMLDRERCGREASPTASIIDSRSVKTCESGGPCGDDAGKKIKGRKHHALVDTDGRALVLFPHPASSQDRDGAGPVPEALRRPFPFLRKVFANAGYQGPRVAAYLARIVDRFERVLTPGLVYDAVADRWAARTDDKPRGKNKTARIVPASDLDALGFALMAEADAAPLRRMTEAMLFRNGLMLALAATLPERARAIAALEFDVTLFLEPGGVIRFATPGEALKVREKRKARRGFHASVHRPSLHRALARWRAIYRPMFDGSAWLWPSRLDQEHGLIPNSISTIIGTVTEQRLGRCVSLHLVRDCVATEIIETDPVSGAIRAKGVLRHRGATIISDFYSHAEGLVVGTEWQEIVDRRICNNRKSLSI